MFLSRSWTERAKCVVEQMDLQLFDLDSRTDRVGNHVSFKSGAKRRREAERLCEGCPVMAECARDALFEATTGMVRGSTSIPYASIRKDTIARLMFVTRNNRPPNALELQKFMRDNFIPNWTSYGIDYKQAS